MVSKVRYSVILVYSTNHAIRIEENLKREGIEAKLIPVPRHLSSDCGSAVRIQTHARSECEEIITGLQVEYDSIVDLD
jgi:hypothetical protein